MLKMIYGCGYLGGRVARRWLDTGHQVAALTRSADRAAALRDEGMTTLVGDVCGVLPPVPAAKVVLYSIGFDRSGGNLMREVYVDGLRRVLDSLRTPPERFLYVSSTGVYGNFDGEWVNEASPCEPTREAGRVCLDAERLLAEHPAAEHAVILRLAGIYGPNRLPRSDDLRAGRSAARNRNWWMPISPTMCVK